MVSNHLRKAKALNGNVQHKPSGTGPKRDDQLKELSNLLKTGQYVEGTEEHTAILEAISTRKEELAKTRATKGASSKAPVIDTSVLPAELQDLAIS